jgi:hypothetical protein
MVRLPTWTPSYIIGNSMMDPDEIGNLTVTSIMGMHTPSLQFPAILMPCPIDSVALPVCNMLRMSKNLFFVIRATTNKREG